MKRKYKTYCPLFPGFYGTIFEYNNEEYDIEAFNEGYKTNFDWDDFEWDYADYHKRISKAFVNWIEGELRDYLPTLKMEFEELHSPKEYNFYNDSIWVKVSVPLTTLFKLIRDNKDKAAAYFEDNYTSRSGFISFHSNQIGDWLNKDYILKDKEHRIGALLDCLCHIMGMDYDSFDFGSENWIDFTPKKEVNEPAN